MAFQSINRRPPPSSPEEPEGAMSDASHSEHNASQTTGEDLSKTTLETSPRALWNTVNDNTSSNKRPKSTDQSKRSHHRAYQTLHTGSKIKHLKKADGEPLWRVDIQYDLLTYIFHDEHKVFKNTYDGKDGQTFADIYIDAMARSSKTSRVLCDKLRHGRVAALNMAMVCLLVNIGRMNTTLNFFLEMRAILRTYHPIPSLQTYSDQNDYKQLQDAPRLKSILKGACEDREEPVNFQELKKMRRTNPINLVFLVSTFASEVQQDFFDSSYEFHDLIMNKGLSSESRARAFLWLMWAYLESDLSPEQLKQNPFGIKDDNSDKIPPLVTLTPEEQAQENIDTPEEIHFAKTMKAQREEFLKNGVSNSVTSGTSGTTSKRSKSSTNTVASSNTDSSNDKSATKLRLIIKRPTKAAPGNSTATKNQTSKEIHKVLKRHYKTFRRARYQEGGLIREWKQVKNVDPLYDSEYDDKPVDEEELNRIVIKKMVTLGEDYGEEDSARLQAFRRASRWFKRWVPMVKPVFRDDEKNYSRVMQIEREQAEIKNIERQLQEERVVMEDKAKEQGIILEFTDMKENGKSGNNGEEKPKKGRKRAKAPKNGTEKPAKRTKKAAVVISPPAPLNVVPKAPIAASEDAVLNATEPVGSATETNTSNPSGPLVVEESNDHQPSVMSLGNLLD